MYRLSHIQIKVNKIEEGIKDFEKVGFIVERGGNKSRNAFIWFEEGPFIELLEMHTQDMPFRWIFGIVYGKAMNARWKKWCTKGEGMIDFAIEPSNHHIDINNFPIVKKEVEKLNLHPSKVITWSRKNIRNEKIHFSYFPILPQALPFIVSAYDIPQRPNNVQHANGITKITGITVVCEEKDFTTYKKITHYDSSIRLKKGAKFKIEEIRVHGLKTPLLHTLLHNAVFNND